MNGNVHPLELLPDYVAGRLEDDEAAAVRGHLEGCRGCVTELRAWQAVAGAAEARFDELAGSMPAGGLAGVLARIEGGAGETALEAAPETVHGSAARPIERASLEARLRWLARFVAAQAPVVRREIWPASAVVMALGAGISLVGGTATGNGAGGAAVSGTALALFAPLAAALGIALIYGQENDPALEIALATPTSPRLVVVARLVVVLAWDLGLALGASAVLAAVSGPALFLPLVALWLGPMLLLGCLTLLLSLFVPSSAAIAVSAAIWSLRALEVSGEPRLHDLGGLTTLLDALWQTSPLTLAAALLALLVAIALAPGREPFGHSAGGTAGGAARA